MGKRVDRTARLTRDVVCVTYPHPIVAGTAAWVAEEVREGTCSAWVWDRGRWVAVAVPTDALEFLEPQSPRGPR